MYLFMLSHLAFPSLLLSPTPAAKRGRREENMALFTTITGFSLFGLASRFGQLAMQKRNLTDSRFFSLCRTLSFPVPTTQSCV